MTQAAGVETIVVGTPKRSALPGIGLLRSTHGLQRATLIAGLVLVAGFILVCDIRTTARALRVRSDQRRRSRFRASAGAVGAALVRHSVRGEDVYSRVIYGARTALMVIVLSLAISLVVGVVLGLVSGYLSGWLDRMLVLVMDALYAMPSLLLAIVVSVVVSAGSPERSAASSAAAVAIMAVFVPQYFRVVRNATVAIKAEPYVDAARVTGASTPRILFRHIFVQCDVVAAGHRHAERRARPSSRWPGWASWASASSPRRPPSGVTT